MRTGTVATLEPGTREGAAVLVTTAIRDVVVGTGAPGHQPGLMVRIATVKATDLTVIAIRRTSAAVCFMGRSVWVMIVLPTLGCSTMIIPTPLPLPVGEGGVTVLILRRVRNRTVSQATILAVTPCTSTRVTIPTVRRATTRTARNRPVLWPLRHLPFSTPPSTPPLVPPPPQVPTRYQPGRRGLTVLLLRSGRRMTVMRNILQRWSRIMAILGTPLCQLGPVPNRHGR